MRQSSEYFQAISPNLEENGSILASGEWSENFVLSNIVIQIEKNGPRLEKLHYLFRTASRQKFPGDTITINMPYFLVPN